MTMRNFTLGLVLFTFTAPAFAEKIEGVDFPPTVSVGGKELKLNGLGLRRVERFGLRFKVYVAALYSEKKLSTAEEAFADSGAKVLKMTFLRRVNAPDLVEPFETGHVNNCVQNCEPSKKVLKEMTAKLPDMLDKNTMEYVFLPDGVEYDLKGRSNLKGKLAGIDIAKNFLAVFIGKKPPTEEFRDGLLGKPKKD